MSTPLPADKEALIARLQESREALDALIAPLSADQLATPGPDSGWAIKDHLHHLTSWQRVQLARMRGEPEWAVLDLDEATYRTALNSAADFADINAIIDRRGAALSAEEALARYRDTFALLLGELDRWTYDDLLRPANPDHPDGPSVLRQLSGDSYEHDDEHRRILATWLPGKS